jgi:predicted homoserine dehydrogenase-like protein
VLFCSLKRPGSFVPLATTIKEGKHAYSDLAKLAWATAEIDFVVEATGNPLVYTRIAFHSIFKKKHLDKAALNS